MILDGFGMVLARAHANSPRNASAYQDWGQLIAPKGRQCSAHELGQGPDHCGQVRGCSWALKGRPGDVYRITPGS